MASKVAPHDGDATEHETRDATPVPLPPPRLPGAPPLGGANSPDAARKIDRAKMNIRRGSRRLKQLFDPKAANDEMQLDLDGFYKARLRRRTHLEQEITGTLVRGGVDPSIHNDAMKTRGIMMTLSPGEEYENYQKVDLASKFQQASLVGPDEPSQMEIEEEAEREDGEIHEHEALTKPAAATTSAAESTPSIRKKTQVLDKTAEQKLATAAAGSKSPTLRRLINQQTIRAHALNFAHSAKMINPHGKYRLSWDVLSIIFIFYNAILLPFQASFSVANVDQDSFDDFLDVFFLFDILVTFNTAVETEGSVRYNRKFAAKTYLKSWFIVDLVAAIPYSRVLPETVSLAGASVRRSLKLLRLVRLMRLFRIARILRRIQNAIFIRSTLTALLKYCLMVMFVSHWFSCIFHVIGRNQTGRNWITANRLQDPYGNKWDRYIAALYFSVMTLATIGFGDVAGTNADERLFSIFAMIVGGGIFAYGITNIVELVSSLTIHETRFRQKMDEVNEYMGARELPLKLRMDIREFYHNTRLSRESKLNGEQQILGELSSKLRSKIALSINDQFLRKFPFFTGSDPNFLLELALNMRMIHFAPLEDVIIEGEIGHEMFFIFRGAVEVLRDSQQIGILGENQYFGEMAILSPDNRRRATVRTLCFCELRMLSRNRFLEALALFPAMQTKMAQVARSRQPQKPPSASDVIKKTSGLLNVPAVIKAAISSAGQASPTKSSPHIPPPHLHLTRQPTTTKLPMGNAATSAAVRLQQNERRNSGAFVPIRATTSARLNAAVRRSSVTGSGNISSAMALALTETSSKLEEATRRQEMLVNRILKMQTELGRLRPATD